MSREICGIIPARVDQLVTKNFSGRRDENYLPECILAVNHMSSHVFKSPSGIYVAWEEDWQCGCCDDDEEDRCIIYGEIGSEEAERLMLLRKETQK